MHYFLLIYFNNMPLHVSSRFAANHQEDQPFISSNWRSYALCWLAVGSSQSTHSCTNCCLQKVDPPDDEQQACSKHLKAYYWNKLIENSESFWFILYGLPILLACNLVPETESSFLPSTALAQEEPNRTVLGTVGNWFALVFHPVQQLCVIKLNFCHYVTSLVIVTDTLDALTAPLFLPDSFESDVIEPPRLLPSVQTIALILTLSRSFVWHNLYFRFQKLFPP